MARALGRHFLLEFYDCDREALNDAERLERAVKVAVKKMGATLIGVAVNEYCPYGVTCVALLAESHLSIHTWPEHGYAAIDIFCCGDTTPELAVDALEPVLEPGQTRCLKLERGFPATRQGPLAEADPPHPLFPGSKLPY